MTKEELQIIEDFCAEYKLSPEYSEERIAEIQKQLDAIGTDAQDEEDEE
jgi:hypothetical protein